MEFFARLILIFVKFIALIAHAFACIIGCLCPCTARKASALPAITDPLLTLSACELSVKLKARQLSVVDLIEAYIARIKAVNPQLNAVIEDRFSDALREAASADALITQRSSDIDKLFDEYPLLGLPVTVKESCAVASMSFAVGSLARSGMRADVDGLAVARLRAAGAIPLLVSATPEYCFSIETATLQNGRCSNPYDLQRTPGGSSGGEGALNGAGASLFGIGSDIGGSIRIPSLFCGLFGHKPTGGVALATNHFPNSTDADIQQCLVVGPISRFAADLPGLLAVMAGENAEKLQLSKPVELKQLKVFYALEFEGFNGWMHQPVSEDIKLAINKALQHFRSLNMTVEHAQLPGMHNSLEIALSSIARLRQMDYLMPIPEGGALGRTLLEYVRSLFGCSSHTTNALTFELMRRANAFMSQPKLLHYGEEAEKLAKEFNQLLGENGVMLFPTMHTTAPRHKRTMLALWGIDYTLIFNVLAVPVTHVPMGLNAEGLPIGFSVIAAPYQDRLCLQVAAELERAFGGWQPPTPHQLKQ